MTKGLERKPIREVHNSFLWVDTQGMYSTENIPKPIGPASGGCRSPIGLGFVHLTEANSQVNIFEVHA